MSHKSFLAYTFCFLTSLALHAQSITIKETNNAISVDGDPSDVAWFEADSAHSFMEYFPADTSLSKIQTVARVLYDAEFIYVLGIMENLTVDREYVTPSLRRDFCRACKR